MGKDKKTSATPLPTGDTKPDPGTVTERAAPDLDVLFDGLLDETTIERDHQMAWFYLGQPAPGGAGDDRGRRTGGVDRLKRLVAGHLVLEEAYAVIRDRVARNEPATREERLGLLAFGTASYPLKMLVNFARSAGVEICTMGAESEAAT